MTNELQDLWMYVTSAIMTLFNDLSLSPFYLSLSYDSLIAVLYIHYIFNLLPIIDVRDGTCIYTLLIFHSLFINIRPSYMQPLNLLRHSLIFNVHILLLHTQLMHFIQQHSFHSCKVSPDVKDTNTYTYGYVHIKPQKPP